MDSYNLVNGQHMSQNGYPQHRDVAKKDWGISAGSSCRIGARRTMPWVVDQRRTSIGDPSGVFMNRANLLPAIQAETVSTANH